MVNAMASIDPFKYEMISDEEKSAYVSPSLTDCDLSKRKNKKNRKNEKYRTDRSFELLPSFQTCE